MVDRFGVRDPAVLPGYAAAAREIPRAWSKFRSIQLHTRSARREGGGHRLGRVRDLGGPSMIGGRLATVEGVRLDVRLLVSVAASGSAGSELRYGWLRLEEVGVRTRLQRGFPS